MSWTPDEAYEEALRRIREAEETGEVELDLKFLLIDFLGSWAASPRSNPSTYPGASGSPAIFPR